MAETDNELPKAFESAEIEGKWYSYWEDQGYFTADSSSDKPAYCLIMPPPNVTGVLHMGHALVTTLQDVLIRWRRMCGDEVYGYLVPIMRASPRKRSLNAASMLKKESEESLFRAKSFSNMSGTGKKRAQHQIINQIKRVGCSCDWSRLRFTMDEGSNKAVRIMFKRLFDQGLIYQGDYLVNWDPVTQTALADDEVESEDRDSFLWHIRYPLVDGSGVAIVATTRPEVMLGDTAVAVSPNDHAINTSLAKKVRLPSYGSRNPHHRGRTCQPRVRYRNAVKITPAHDPNDYQMGQRHNLPIY